MFPSNYYSASYFNRGFYPKAPAWPAASAAFVRQDAATQGSWKGVYGSDGYVVSQGPGASSRSLPPYAALSLAGNSSYTWAASTSDARALQNAAPASADRVAATWVAASQFSADVNLTDGKAHRLAVYLLGWDSNYRDETVAVLDAATGAVLDSRRIQGFQDGVYLVWTVTGRVTLNFTSNTTANVVAGGIFLDPAPADATAIVAFVGQDASTQGTWKGVYGSQGYAVSQDPSPNNPNLPPYAALSLAGNNNYTWAASTADARATQKSAAGSADRVAGTWTAPAQFSAGLSLGDGCPHRVALYVLGWDNNYRDETVAVSDAVTGAVLDSRRLTGFQDGVYLVWTVRGNVTFRVATNSTANVVLSGIFLDPSV